MAAAARGGGLAVAGCNYVAQDQIWKDHVHQETAASKRWPENWDFMTTKYEDMVKDEIVRKERVPIAPPTPARLPQMTPLDQRIEVKPSPQPVPKTTASMIGWRSTNKECRLEKYGSYAKPKGGLVRQLGWPAEGVD